MGPALAEVRECRNQWLDSELNRPRVRRKTEALGQLSGVAAEDGKAKLKEGGSEWLGSTYQDP